MDAEKGNRECKYIYLERELEKYRKICKEKKRTHIRRKIAESCKCSAKTLKNVFFSIFPILHWLPRYNSNNLFGDFVAGITVGIVQIPQGMAYGLLASLPPIIGMYVSFFPVLFYPLFGTSRHLSIGTFAVASILIYDVIAKRVPDSFCENNFPVNEANTANIYPPNSTSLPLNSNVSSVFTASIDCLNLYESRKLEVAVALSACVGLIQILMYIFQLGKVTVFLSESLVSGFVSGASIHVITSQIPKLFGISLPRKSGAFSLIFVYVDLFKNISKLNWGTFVVSLICIAFLVVGKKINSRYHKKLPLPIPWELFIVILTTLASHYGGLAKHYDVVVVGKIPTGITTSVPNTGDIFLLMVDAIPLAIVIFTVEISLCQMFATKHGYDINSNQELLALGACNLLSSFFTCFPSAASLSRSVIYEEIGGNTQLGGFVSSVVVLAVLLWIGPLFEALPQASLAVIIIVNIKRLAMMPKNVKPLWNVSRLDALTWVVAWLAVVLFGVGMGLVIGISFSLFTVLCRTRSARGASLEMIEHTDIFKDSAHYHTSPLPENILVFRFSGPLYFANKDRFLDQLVAKLGYDPSKNIHLKNPVDSIHSKPGSTDDCGNSMKSQESVTKYMTSLKSSTLTIDCASEMTSSIHKSESDAYSDSSDERMLSKNISSAEVKPCLRIERGDVIKSHVILDLSLCAFMDSDGAKIILGLYDNLKSQDVQLMLASCCDEVRARLSSLWGDRETITFVSVAAAVKRTRHDRVDQAIVLSDNMRIDETGF